MTQVWPQGKAETSFMREHPQRPSYFPREASPFTYHEMAFPVPRNSTDLDSLTLRQLHDYTFNESPRVREKTGFTRHWHNQLSFRRCKGLCAQFLDSPSPPRYRKAELEGLRLSKLLAKGQSHKSTPAARRKLQPTSELRRAQATPGRQLRREINEFERRLPSLRVANRAVYEF